MKKRERRVPIQRIILHVIALAGVLTAAAVVPNAVAELRKFDPAYAKQKNIRRRIQETLWRMERNKLVTLPDRWSMGRVSLLPKGEALIEKIQAQEYIIPEPLLWDGKWRMVMFDVPEARKSIRNQLRLLLQSAGLLRLHDSVWVHPYPCDELVTLIKAHLKNTRGEVHYIVSELVGSDRFLREKFGL